ncbi:MAG TPA: hypothetical protein VGQ83_29280 [Polyangia bacterium]
MRYWMLASSLALLLATPGAWALTCPCYDDNTCNGDCGGSVCCNFGCTDYSSDPFNCGSCGHDCGPQSTCVGGVCRCVSGSTRTWCYSGPPGTIGVGICHPGSETCVNGAWGPCTGEQTPRPDTCNGLDDDCDGRTDNVAGSSSPLSQPCYDGPAGTAGVGVCHGGQQVCQAGAYGACLNEVVPVPGALCATPESCVSTCIDAGVPDAAVGDATVPDGSAGDGPGPDGGPQCVGGGTCYEGPPGTAGIGDCRAGTLVCDDGGLICQGQAFPSAPRCDGLDHDCNGVPDTACPNGQDCANGVCVPRCVPDPDTGVGICPTGYTCGIGSNCVPIPCPTAICPVGNICVMGACVPPCGGRCGPTEACFNETCVPNDCTTFGCLTGFVCVAGECRPDPCATVSCAPTDLCRDGLCVPACAFLDCPAGEICGPDGACHVDPCAGVSCTPPEVCIGGTCGADPCASVVCPPADVCRGGACIPNACAGVTCPAGTECRDGQCYGVAPVADAGTAADAAAADAAGGQTPLKSGCGCKVGAAAGTEASGLLILALAVVLLRAGRKSRDHAART